MSDRPVLWLRGADGLVGRSCRAACEQAGWAVTTAPSADLGGVDALLDVTLTGPFTEGLSDLGPRVRALLALLEDTRTSALPVLVVLPGDRDGAAGTLPSDPLARAASAVAAIAAPHAHVSVLHVIDAYGEGAGPDEGGAVERLRQAVAQGPVLTRDHGYALRRPIHVDDVARAVVLLLGADERPASCEVCGPTAVPVRDLVARLGGILGDGPSMALPALRHTPDLRPLTDLGWSPTVSLDAGLGPARTPQPVRIIRPVYDPDDALLDVIRDALDRGMASNGGPQVRGLEHDLASAFDAPHVLAVSSGATGLEVALRALDVGGAAILPSWTYVATLNAVETCGLRPVFCDVDPETWTLDPRHVATLLDDHRDVGVIVAVNSYGVHPDLTALRALADARGLPILYDAAHAVGAKVRGRVFAPEADVTVYSLHATKVLPATEGGAVATADPALAARMDAIRTHGNTSDLRAHVPGLNAKMDELAAAVARHGLHGLPAGLARRRAAWDRLRHALATAGWTVQRVPADQRPNGQNLCARPPGSRERAQAVLDEHGVGHRRYFQIPLHTLDRLRPQPPLPVTEALDRDLLCLPLHARMTEADLLAMEQAIAAVGEEAP